MHTATPHGCRHASEGHPFDSSDLCLLGNLQGIIYLYAKVSHRRFQLGVPEQQLHSSKVFGAAVDERLLQLAETGVIDLPEHDYQVLKRWQRRSYGF